MKTAQVYYNLHPTYLIGPLNAFEVGEIVKIPKGRGAWYAVDRKEDQEAKVIGGTPYKDGVAQAVVACPNCNEFHLGECESG